MPVKKKKAAKVVKKAVNKVAKKSGKEVCLTCKNRNRPQNIRDGVCVTCKRSNNKPNIITI